MIAGAVNESGAPTAVRAASGPLFPDTGIIALVPERWGGMWLSRQQILTRLSRYFPVLWFDPSIGWRKLWTGRDRTAVGSDATPAPQAAFTVFRQSRWLPRFHRPDALARFTWQSRLREARRRLEDEGCSRVILYLWRPEYASALDVLEHDLSCYHIADEYSFSADEHPITAAERSAIERVDQVFIHSPALMEKKGNINPNTSFVTNGVDFDAFAHQRPEPADLASVPHPRIGYVGRIKTQLDWDLLGEICGRHPEWSFVFVGPTGFLGEDGARRDALFERSNVHYLGNRPIADVPAYTQHMDVCMLCYTVNAYTNYIFPLKLHEYLAAGRPVVGTPIRSLEAFSPVVRVARGADEWSQALSEAVSADAVSPERIAARREVAQRYDWNDLTASIARTLCVRLGPDYVARFDAAGGAEGTHRR